MKWVPARIFAAAFAILAAQAAQAVPPDPAVIEQWAREGRLETLASIERAARQKGVNRATGLATKGHRDVTGSRQAIVILVDFDDETANLFLYPPEHFEDMLFSQGTYATGSLRDYYAENSYGQLDITGTVVGWYRMPEDYTYYTDGQYGFGNYPQNAQRLAEEAVLAADPDVDFSLYDNDGPDGVPNSGDDDGYVDALFVVHAGAEGAGGGGWGIWSHAWATSYDVPVDGVHVYGYSMEPEEGTIGVYCHELGHVLGLPDLYDYDYDSAGVGYWSVMSFGVHRNGGRTPVQFDAWCKTQLGWIDPVVLEYDETGVEIPAAETHPVAYKLWTDGDPSNQFFVIEYREQQLFDTYLPGEGLLVYHVDENSWNNDEQCCGSCFYHFIVAVEQADGECDLEYFANYGDVGDPFPGTGGVCNPNTTLDAASTPSSRAYDDHDTEVALRNISLVGGSAVVDIEVGQQATGVSTRGRGETSRNAALGVANPYEPGSPIRYSVAPVREGEVSKDAGERVSLRLAVYDVRGRHVRTLIEGPEAPGPGEVSWDGRDARSRPVPSGVYFVSLEAGDGRVVRKLLLAK